MHGFRITPCAGGAALVAAVEAGGMVPPFQEKPFPRGDVAEAPPAGGGGARPPAPQALS